MSKFTDSSPRLVTALSAISFSWKLNFRTEAWNRSQNTPSSDISLDNYSTRLSTLVQQEKYITDSVWAYSTWYFFLFLAEISEYHGAGKQTLHRFLWWEAAERAGVQGAVWRPAEDSISVHHFGRGASSGGGGPAKRQRQQRWHEAHSNWASWPKRYRLH